jgi:hypothetical protein
MTEKTGKVHAVVMWLDYTVATDVDEAMKRWWLSKPDTASKTSFSLITIVFCVQSY